jgi:predicted transcriptional regulator
VQRGLRQARAGQLVDDKQVWKEVKKLIAAAARKRARKGR